MLLAVAIAALTIAFQQSADAVSPVTNIDLPGQPFLIVTDQPHHRAYVTLYAQDSVAVIDTDTRAVLTTMPTGARPRGLALDPETGWLWVANWGAQTMTVFDVATLTVVMTVPGGTDVAIDSVARHVYATSSLGLTMLNADTGDVLSSTNSPHNGTWWGVTVDPTDSRVYVAELWSPTILVFDAATLAPLDAVAVPRITQFGMAVDATRHRLYVGTDYPEAQGANSLQVLDTTTDTLAATIAMSGEPHFVAVDSARDVVHLAMGSSAMVPAYGSVATINPDTLSTLRTAAVGVTPRGAAVAADGTVFTTSAQNELFVVPIDCCSATIDELRIWPAAPKTNDTATASAQVRDGNGTIVPLTYQWLKNGVELPDQTQQSLALYLAGNGDRGDSIAVRITAFAGTDHPVVATSAPRTIVNSAPVVNITGLNPLQPHTNDMVSIRLWATDPDGDPLAVSYQWHRNGIDIAGASGPTLDLAVAGNGDKGDGISATVAASDGSLQASAVSPTAFVTNTPPQIANVVLTPTTPRTNDVVTALPSAFDPDGDPVTLAYVWFKNGSTIPGATFDHLDLAVAGNGDRGDSIAVQVFASDGSDRTATLSRALVIANTAPTLTISLNTSSPRPNDTLVVTAVATDPDGDSIGFTYIWKTNGLVRRAVYSVEATSDSFDLRRPGYGNNGDVITVEVTAYDGDLTTTATDTAVVTNHPR